MLTRSTVGWRTMHVLVSLFLMVAMGSACSKEDTEDLTEEEQLIQAYLARNQIDVEPTESGLYFINIIPGEGKKPQEGDYIIANYSVRLISEILVYTTHEDLAQQEGIYSPNRLYGPDKFLLDAYPVAGVIEGLQLMRAGGTAKLIIPSKLAYGDTPHTQIPAHSALIYEIELLDAISDPVAHENQLIEEYMLELGLETNPLESGLYYMPVKEGSGRRPVNHKGVSVLFTGKLIDDRVFADHAAQPVDFILGRNVMVPGFEEGLMHMKEGGQAKFIVPSHLAYGAEGSPDNHIHPYMTLIYEVELLDVFETFPGETWEYWNSFAEAGFVAESRNTIESRVSGLNTSGFMVIVDGRVLFDYGDLISTTYLASVRKSVLSMLFGRYVQSGHIDLTYTLEELGIDDHQGLLPVEKRATIEDIISCRSGVFHPASNTGDDSQHAPPRGSVEPGTYFLYNNWDFNAAGGIFEQLTQTDIYDALRDDLAIPLQMQDFERNNQRRGGNLSISRYPAYHMYISTRDMARLGLLMLNKGRWVGEQIIPEEWVEQSTRVITPVHEMNPESRRNGLYGYGYMWWVYDGEQISDDLFGAFNAMGAYGQFITVIPNLNMVVAHKTDPDQGRTTQSQYHDLLQLILSSVDD